MRDIDMNLSTEPVHSLFQKCAASSPNSIAIVDSRGRSVTYGDLSRRSSALASNLIEYGITRGKKVAFVAYNSIEFLESFLGVMSSGATAVLIDPTTMSEDLAFQLRDSAPSAVITDETVLSRESDVLMSLGDVVLVNLNGNRREEVQSYSDLVRERAVYEVSRVDPYTDVSVVFYYAGVAGRTMQVFHSHAGLSLCIETIAQVLDFRKEERTLMTAPLPHVLGLTQALSHFAACGTVALVEKRGSPLDTIEVLSFAERVGVKSIWGAPSLYKAIVDAVSTHRVDLPKLRYCVSAGGYLPPEVQKRFAEGAGCPLIQLYGLTEGLVVSLQTLKESYVVGTIGRPLPFVEVKVVKDDGALAGAGEVGELLVRSPWVMLGYSDPQDTARAITDGWLRTGDLVTYDDLGLLYFKGVKKRMIKYKGYPVFPRDLEVLLAKHPAVERALVIGEQDEEVGERPVARVVLKRDYVGKVAPEELMAFVNSRVAAYKKLRDLRIVDEI